MAPGGRDAAIWLRALPYLGVRDNDAHTLYAWGLASALLSQLPTAREEVVLPAILLHDTGWSTVSEGDALEAIAPGGRRKDLVRHHEIEGARIATAILDELGIPVGDRDEIVAIIDGHDSRLEALSLNDAIVKDADKLWRLTPHGIDTVCRWFGVTRREALRLCSVRVQDELFTEPGRAMGRALAAVASVSVGDELTALRADSEADQS
ncbi:metal-dependent phosphohydrolase [Marisediminicola antarctica]|uniref:Metal-dependent phosphohydrolase n=1 Tax=Marisediminicola antarctica TaxID=674079 RepID=A0A7L5AJY3_9MICO|nr:metal-dependent phosphohydrolase [Marisediminicola antarctica]